MCEIYSKKNFEKNLDLEKKNESKLSMTSLREFGPRKSKVVAREPVFKIRRDWDVV